MTHINWKTLEKLDTLDLDCLSFLIPPEAKYFTDSEIFIENISIELPEFNVDRWHGPIVSKKTIKTSYSYPYEVESTVYRWYEDELVGLKLRMEILFINKEYWYCILKQNHNFMVVSLICGHPEVICNKFCWGNTQEDTSINLSIENFDNTNQIVSYIMDSALQLINNSL